MSRIDAREGSGLALGATLIGVIAASACSTSRDIDSNAFDGIYKACKAVQSAVQSGVTRIQLRSLIVDATTEINLAAERGDFRSQPPTNQNHRLVILYEAALDAYRDGLSLSMQFMQDHDSRELVEIETKYRLPYIRRSNSLFDEQEKQWDSDIKKQVSQIWEVADRRLDHANRVYLGREGIDTAADAVFSDYMAIRPDIDPSNEAMVKRESERVEKLTKTLGR